MKTKPESEAKQHVVIVQPTIFHKTPEAYSIYAKDSITAIFEVFPYLRQSCFKVSINTQTPQFSRIFVDDTFEVDSFQLDFQTKGSAK